MMEAQAEYKTKENYFAIERMSNSAMSYFKRSPKHYLNYLKADKKETPAMTFGSAFHCLILEKDKFSSQFAIAPDVDRRTKEGKETYNAFSAGLNGRSVISDEDFNKMCEMESALFAHAPSRELLDEIKEAEKPILWTDYITKIELKGKVDAIGTDFILDLKTTQDAQPDEFARAAWNYGYHRQAALYLDGCKENGIQAKDFYFIAIEKEQPYGISVHKCTPEFIQKGREAYEQILQDFLSWKNQGSPDVGYEWSNPFSTFDLNTPAWVK